MPVCDEATQVFEANVTSIIFLVFVVTTRVGLWSTLLISFICYYANDQLSPIYSHQLFHALVAVELGPS